MASSLDEGGIGAGVTGDIIATRDNVVKVAAMGFCRDLDRWEQQWVKLTDNRKLVGINVVLDMLMNNQEVGRGDMEW